MKQWTIYVAALAAGTGLILATGCGPCESGTSEDGEAGTMEKAGAALDQTGETIVEGAKDVSADIAEGAGKAADATVEAVDKAVDATTDAAMKAGESIGKEMQEAGAALENATKPAENTPAPATP